MEPTTELGQVPITTKKSMDLLMYIVTIVCLACVLGDVALIAYTRVVIGGLKDDALKLNTNTLKVKSAAPYFKDYLSNYYHDTYESGELQKMFADFKVSYIYYLLYIFFNSICLLLHRYKYCEIGTDNEPESLN